MSVSDKNEDKVLDKFEVLDNYKVFIGSQATDYGKGITRHEELWDFVIVKWSKLLKIPKTLNINFVLPEPQKNIRNIKTSGTVKSLVNQNLD